jgi:hypothetical protein
LTRFVIPDGGSYDSIVGRASLIAGLIATCACGRLFGLEDGDGFVDPPVGADAEAGASVEGGIADTAPCDGVDVMTNPRNCGSCGNVCRSGGCTGGACDLVAFVTSGTFAGSLGGTMGADGRCNAAARNAAGGALPGDYLAWIGAVGTSPRVRFGTEKRTWRRLDGALVAHGFGELADGNLANALDRTETGGVLSDFETAWTGAVAGGDRTNVDCADWIETGGNGTNGSVGATDSRWSNTGPAAQSCSTPRHLYCFQVKP